MRRITVALWFLFPAATAFADPSAAAHVASPTPLDERLAQERRWLDSGLFMVPHKPNYFLFWAFNTNPNDTADPGINADTVKRTESKFQISFKIPVGRGLFAGNGDLYFAYTQLSLWQVYNRRNSAPFRDNNYEPELFLNFDTDVDVGPFNNRVISVGVVHQSNGQTYPLSRSWNRAYAAFMLQRERWVLFVRPWYRLPDPERYNDNPDIEKYEGYGDFRAVHAWGASTFSLLLRNNLRFPHNKGAIELGFSFPISRIVRGYIQYFNGYAESLIDYNHPNNRLSLGIALSDWI